MAAQSSPTIINGMEERSMRRLPTLSMTRRDMMVNRKFVEAITSEGNVGFWKPTSLKMVAEK
jgi:hypothetical protein